jgi:hypothetical protein
MGHGFAEPTPDRLIQIFLWMLLIFAVLGCGWVGLYQLWNKHFRRVRELDIDQKMGFFVWLLATVIIGLTSVVVIAIFSVLLSFMTFRT